MSVVAAGERLAEIQSLIASVATRTPQAGSTSAFSRALASARMMPPTAVAAAGDVAAGAATYGAQIDDAARRNGVDPALLRGLIRQESGFNPAAKSSAGAIGLTQLMPTTAASLGVDPTDPTQAIEGGARYLRQQLDTFGGDESKALAAYNAGPSAVTSYGGIPPYAETQRYVASVLSFAAQERGSTTTATSAVPVTTTPVTSGALSYSTL
jgi:soluble lytic murein transglycosylase-like protein